MIRHLEISSIRLALAATVVGLAAMGCTSTPYKAEVATTQPSTTTLGPLAGANSYGGFKAVAKQEFTLNSPFTRAFITKDFIIIYTQSNQAFRLSHELDVEQIKQITTPDDRLRAPLQMGDRMVYPTGITFELYKSDGQHEKTVSLRSPLTSDAAFDPRGYLVVGTASPTGGRVTVVDPNQTYGTIVMESMPTPVGAIRATPAAYQGTVYAASDVGKIFAISSDNHSEWTLPTGGFDVDRLVADKLVADDYGLFISGGDTTLYAIDRNSGKIRWRYMAEHALEEAPLVTGDRVYQIVPNKGLVALDKLNGKLYREPLWTVKGATQILSVDDRRIYALSDQKQVLAIERATGEVKFTGDVSDYDFFTMNPLNNMIYALTKNGKITAIKASENVGLANAQ